MSKSMSVTLGPKGFWAFDVFVGVLLKYLIDAAQASADANTGWLSKAVSNWRVWAVIGDFGLPLDEQWSTEQRNIVIALVEQACASLAKRDLIPADEIASWRFVDDLRIYPRGAEVVLTAPVIELGRAIIALLRGENPEAPNSNAWFYGKTVHKSAEGR